MDCGTLSDLVSGAGPIPEPVLAKLSAQLLEGLIYLHKVLHIIHRDIKPQNILINSNGHAKITDFGVSGELANTQAMAKTFVGTVKYMSPWRIAGKQHSAKSDIWSFGLVMLECALGYYPYGPDDSKLTFFQLLNDIVQKPAPLPPSDKFSPDFCSFIKDCLQKDEGSRPDAQTLLRHPFIQTHANDPIDLAEWIRSKLSKIGKR
jgi:mitogen-activated protein kinase kinase 1